MDDLSRFCCQNSTCRDYGQRGLENLTVCGRFAKDQRIRLLYCRTCKARFSERKGTPLFNTKLADDKSLSLLEHLHEGCGVRQTSRLVGVHRDTVTRLARLAGDHTKALHDEWVSISPSNRRSANGRAPGSVGVRRQETEAWRR